MATVTGKLIKFLEWQNSPQFYKKRRHCKCIRTKVFIMGSMYLIQDPDGLCDYHAKKFHSECETADKIRLELRGGNGKRKRNKKIIKEEKEDDS
jgi:hypothetical protein